MIGNDDAGAPDPVMLRSVRLSLITSDPRRARKTWSSSFLSCLAEVPGRSRKSSSWTTIPKRRHARGRRNSSPRTIRASDSIRRRGRPCLTDAIQKTASTSRPASSSGGWTRISSSWARSRPETFDRHRRGRGGCRHRLAICYVGGRIKRTVGGRLRPEASASVFESPQYGGSLAGRPAQLDSERLRVATGRGSRRARLYEWDHRRAARRDQEASGSREITVNISSSSRATSSDRRRVWWRSPIECEHASMDTPRPSTR